MKIKESIKYVIEAINRNPKIMHKHIETVDAVDYVNSVVTNAKNDLIYEVITYERNEERVLKRHIISYNGKELRNEIIYNREL